MNICCYRILVNPGLKFYEREFKNNLTFQSTQSLYILVPQTHAVEKLMKGNF